MATWSTSDKSVTLADCPLFLQTVHINSIHLSFHTDLSIYLLLPILDIVSVRLSLRLVLKSLTVGFASVYIASVPVQTKS